MNREDVEFTSEGVTVRGWLYHSTEPATEPPPAVVLAGGWCYVRELVMPYYAAAFADAGIAALVFDYQNLGVSDGDVRQHLDPWLQIRDYQNALSYLESRDDIDAERLGAWGISYSGGHVLILAAIDPRIRAIVSQIPVIDGYHNMRRVHGTMGYRKLWDVILEDRRNRYADPATRLYIPHATAEPDRDLSTWPFPETYADVQDAQGARGPAVREPQHRRVGRPAAQLRRDAVRAAHLRHADADDRGQWRRPHALGSGDRRLQRPADGGPEVDGASPHHPHDPVQRPRQARHGGA